MHGKWNVLRRLDVCGSGSFFAFFDVKTEPLTFVKGMQFAVPRMMIVNKPYAMWRDLYLHFMSDERNAWFYEMIWPTLFAYDHPN